MNGIWKGISILVIWVSFGGVTVAIAIYAKEFLPIVIGMGTLSLLATLAVTHAK